MFIAKVKPIIGNPNGGLMNLHTGFSIDISSLWDEGYKVEIKI
jgi:hypothetical protein